MSSPSSNGAEALPAELQTHLDFVSNLLIVFVSFVFRKLDLLKEEHIPGLRAAAFNFALPALMLGLLWQTVITMEIARVLFVSAATCTLSTIIACVLSRFAHPMNRGLYGMALTGNAIPFVYPVLLNSDKFGLASVAVAIMWDLGGNMWVNFVYYAFIGERYAPPAETLYQADKLTSVVTSASGPSTRPRSRSNSHVAPEPEGIGASNLAGDAESGRGLPVSMCAVDPVQVLDALPSGKGASSGAQWKKILAVLAKNVTLWSCALGLLLNALKVPFFVLPGRSLNVLGSAFAPLLYSLVGANLRFDLGLASYGLVVRVLMARWSVSLAMAGLVLYLPWGLEEQLKSVLVLCLAAPLPSMFVMYTGLFGYRTDQAVMIFNISAIMSLLALSALAPTV